MDANSPLSDMRLQEPGFGDPEENIPGDRIKETNEYGWRICEGGARYGVSQGRIVVLNGVLPSEN